MSILRVNRLGSGQGVVFDKILMQFHSCLAICCAACYFGFGGFCTVKVTFINARKLNSAAIVKQNGVKSFMKKHAYFSCICVFKRF